MTDTNSVFHDRSKTTRQRPGHEADDVELRHRQDAEREGDRDARDQRRPPEVAPRSSAGAGCGRDRARRRPAARTAGAGSSPTAVSVPIWVASAPRVRTATRGSPSWVTWSPKTEIVWPSQSRRKSGASKSSGGMKRRISASALNPGSGPDRRGPPVRRRVRSAAWPAAPGLPCRSRLAVRLHAPDHVQPEEPRPDESHDQPDEEPPAPSWDSTVSRGR